MTATINANATSVRTAAGRILSLQAIIMTGATLNARIGTKFIA